MKKLIVLVLLLLLLTSCKKKYDDNYKYYIYVEDQVYSEVTDIAWDGNKLTFYSHDDYYELINPINVRIVRSDKP